MIFLLDAQTSVLVPNTADARNMKAAKESLTEIRVAELIRDDSESISGMDRQDATILVDTLNGAKDRIMPKLAAFVESREAGDRLVALIGQSTHSLTGTGDGHMQSLRSQLILATGLGDDMINSYFGMDPEAMRAEVATS